MLCAIIVHAWCTCIMHSLPYKTSKVEQVSRAQAREEIKHISQTAAGKPVRIQSSWFRSGYAHGVSGDNQGIMPHEPTDQAVLSVEPRILAIEEDDGSISDLQLR